MPELLVRNRSPHAIGRALHGARFEEPRRHGNRHDRVIFVYEDGELRYNNTRRFGGVWLADDHAERDAVTGPLDPDAAALGGDASEKLCTDRDG